MGASNEVIFTPNVSDGTNETDVTTNIFKATFCTPNEPMETSDNSPATSCTPNDQEGTLHVPQTDPKKTLRLEATAKYLISRDKQLRPKVGKTVSLKTKKQMWKIIAEELCAMGSNINGQQVEAKFFTLERQYKKTVMHNSKTGRNRQTCLFKNDLDDLFKERKAINPEFVLASAVEVVDDVLVYSVLDQPSTSRQGRADDVLASPELELPPSAKKKRAAIEDFMEKTEDRAKRREENDKITRERYEEFIKKREERAQEEERAKEKMQLLRELVASTRK